MIELRIMGDEQDIDWFYRVLEKTLDVEVVEVSDFYTNRGTNRYYRIYVEVDKAKEININNTEEE